MSDLTDILRCPATTRSLSWTLEGRLTAEGGPSYEYKDGIARLLPRSQAGFDIDDASQNVLDFYESDGWVEDENGKFGETKSVTDVRSVSVEFSNRCTSRIGRYFRNGGRYLLDAGSGPIPHDALLKFGDHFQQRVCLDLSVQGLKVARRKLGERGVYLQGDLTNMPLATHSMDAVTCNHVLYQMPPEVQLKALHEVWRVLKPGGVAVMLYFWPRAPLDWRLERVAKGIFRMRVPECDSVGEGAGSVELPHYPMPESWFKSQNLPFDYKLDTFRAVGQHFMKRNVSDDWRGRTFLNALFTMQVLAPKFFAKHGAVPAIVIRKPKA